jgi:hypothetical protein
LWLTRECAWYLQRFGREEFVGASRDVEADGGEHLARSASSPRCPWTFSVSTSTCRPEVRLPPVDGLETLTRESILATLGGEAAELRRMGVKSLALFGSIARGEGTQTSDVSV